ncbi:MAG: sugar phosphate nucleotidyltransferase, partial [Crocinitomicaceae bacterium]
MEKFDKYLIHENANVREALVQLDKLAADATLFVISEDRKLIGSITDGDVRRALIEGKDAQASVMDVINKTPKFIRKGENALRKLIEFRSKNILIIPVLEKDNDVISNVINLRLHRSYLPIDAVIMAGGKGQRLRPLTETTPKPLLKVGDTPIIERNIDRLGIYGIDDINISVNYLGEQLESYFGDGSHKGLNINYVWEDSPLGTIGAVSKIQEFQNDYILVMNSDLLTNIDFESFFMDFLEADADLSILSIPYTVDVPYAVLETDNQRIISLKEKPRYTYYSNGGIYLMKKEVLARIPKGEFFNAT